jgi:hypothetical protein
MGDMADDLINDLMESDWIYGSDWEETMPTKKRVKKTTPTPKKAVKKPRTKAMPRARATPKAAKLELLLKSITEHYPKDPSAPGLAIAALPGGKFYVAIRRFKGYGGTQPEVVDSTSADTLLEAMNKISDNWRSWLMKTTATEEFLRLR